MTFQLTSQIDSPHLLEKSKAWERLFLSCPSAAQALQLSKAEGKANHHNKDLQPPKEHADHLDNERRVIGGRPRDSNGKTNRAQRRSKIKHGLRQSTARRDGHSKRTDNVDQKILHHKARGVLRNLLVDRGLPRCLHVFRRLDLAVGGDLSLDLQSAKTKRQIHAGELDASGRRSSQEPQKPIEP